MSQGDFSGPGQMPAADQGHVRSSMMMQIAQKADEIFGQLFSEKLFRAQLCYFKDIDYAEEVEYLIQAVSDSELKNFLTEQATDIL